MNDNVQVGGMLIPGGSSLSDTSAVKRFLDVDIDPSAFPGVVLADGDILLLCVTTPVPPPLVPPGAEFTSTVTGLTVAFDASSSVADDPATIASYAWDFGDGAVAAGVTASHTYATAGAHPVTLTVTDSNGLTGVAAATVTLASLPPGVPTAAFTDTISGLVVTFNGAGSTPVTGATITGYAWAFGDGATGVGVNPSHTYKAGTYAPVLTVTDSNGLKDTQTHTVTLGNAPPPPPTSTVIGISTRSGFDIASISANYGAQPGCVRLFWSGSVGAVPSTNVRIVGSFKNLPSGDLTAVANWARQMYKWTWMHEVDHKLRTGEVTLPVWKAGMARLVALGIPGLVTILTADVFVNKGKNPNDFIVPGVKEYWIDTDGSSQSVGYHDYTTEINRAKAFCAANNLILGIGEQGYNRALSGDPDGTHRAQGLTDTAHAEAAAGARTICLWEADSQKGSTFTSAAEKAAVKALFLESG